MHVDTNVPSFARSFQDVACKISENKVCLFLELIHKLAFLFTYDFGNDDDRDLINGPS